MNLIASRSTLVHLNAWAFSFKTTLNYWEKITRRQSPNIINQLGLVETPIKSSQSTLDNIKTNPYYDFIGQFCDSFEIYSSVPHSKFSGQLIDSYLLEKRQKNTFYDVEDGSKCAVMIMFKYQNQFFAVVDKWYNWENSFIFYSKASYEERITEIIAVEKLQIPLLGFFVGKDVLFCEHIA
jgi:hypothetical protein